MHLYGQDSMTIDPHTLRPAEDVPLGGLPSADPTLLGNAPLEVAVIEIRYTARTDEITPEVAAAFRDDLVENTGGGLPEHSTHRPTADEDRLRGQRRFPGGSGVQWVANCFRGRSTRHAHARHPDHAGQPLRAVGPTSMKASANRSGRISRTVSQAIVGAPHRSAVRRPLP